MGKNLWKRLAQLVPVLAVAVMVLADARPASAGCFIGLRSCYYRVASASTDMYELWLAGLDCELEFTDCVRRAIIGR